MAKKNVKAPRKNGRLEAPEAVTRAALLEDDEPTPDSLERVRDILFGSQQRDTERRLGELEEQIGLDLDAMRDDLGTRLEDAVAKIDDRLTDLSARLDDSVRDLKDAAKTAHGEIRDEIREMDRSHTDAMRQLDADGIKRTDELGRQLDEQAAASESRDSDLRSALDDTATAVRDELATVRDELNEALDAAVAQLGDAKADRSALAELFSDAAARLADEPAKPSRSRK